MYARSSVLTGKNVLAESVAASPTLKFLDVHYDETIETLWMRIKESSTRHFAEELLQEIVLVQTLAKNSHDGSARGFHFGPVKHLGVFWKSCGSFFGLNVSIALVFIGFSA